MSENGEDMEKKLTKRQEYNRKYCQEHNKYFREYYRKYRKDNMKKEQARHHFKYEVKAGRIKRGTCEVCGESATNAHHPDYNKPLNVVEFCSMSHHAQWVRENELNE